VRVRGIVSIGPGLMVSKKDIQVRRQELLESISEDLITTATSKAEELMRDPLAIQVVQEIILYTRGTVNLHMKLSIGNKSDLVDKVISLALGDPTEDSHVMKLPFTARVYKTLVQGGHFNAKAGTVEGRTTLSNTIDQIVTDPDLKFASKLKVVIQPYLVSWATGEGSFVVLGLLEALSGKEKEDVVSHLKKIEKSIRNKGAGNKGAKLILEKTLEEIS
jgi:pumilio family protein 6